MTECLGDLIRAIKRDDEVTNGVTHQLGIWQVLQEHLLPILHTYKEDEMLIRAASTSRCLKTTNGINKALTLLVSLCSIVGRCVAPSSPCRLPDQAQPDVEG